MKKYFLSLSLILIFLLTGCGDSKASEAAEERYKEKATEAVMESAKLLLDIATPYGSGYGADVSQVQYVQILNDIESFLDSMEDFQSLEPPEKLKTNHDNMISIYSLYGLPAVEDMMNGYTSNSDILVSSGIDSSSAFMDMASIFFDNLSK